MQLRRYFDVQIYRKTYGQHVGFKMFMDAMLLSLARKVVQYFPVISWFIVLGIEISFCCGIIIYIPLIRLNEC